MRMTPIYNYGFLVLALYLFALAGLFNTDKIAEQTTITVVSFDFSFQLHI